MLTNLTNSPLASSASPVPHPLVRSLSGKSLLGEVQSSSLAPKPMSASTMVTIGTEAESPTCRDFQLLSEHLEDCDFGSENTNTSMDTVAI